jgi:hypothetical protein
MNRPPREVVVTFTESRDQPAAEARSTLLTTSIQALRARGHATRYEEALRSEAKQPILTVVAGVWLPIDLAVAHYEACEALGLPVEEQLGMGIEVGERVQGTMLGLVARTAKTAGVTPWTGLAHAARLYERIFRGGAVQVSKLGPKEAELELVNNRVFGIDYARNGLRGVTLGGLKLFAEKVYVHEMPTHGSPSTFVMRISWA